MKKFVLVLLVVAVGLGGLAFVNPAFMRWIRHTTGTAPVSTKVYKWQDKDGNWHITSERPPAGVKYQEQEYLHDTNVLPAPKTDKQ